MRPVRFLGDSLQCLRDFPKGVKISSRCPPSAKAWRRFAFLGSTGAYRVIYVARRAEAVYVLHERSSNREETI
jgi:phage-related protein